LWTLAAGRLKGSLEGLGLALAASPVFSDEAGIIMRLCTRRLLLGGAK
jgi:hypothetical protein